MKTELILIKGRVSNRDLVRYLCFLLSKWSYEGLTSDEVNQVWQICLWMREKTKLENFGGFNSTHIALLEESLRDIKAGIPRSGYKFLPINPILRIMIYTAHKYFGLKAQGYFNRLKGTFSSIIVEKRRWPPQRFIGVGYRDKGSRRDKAKDGSPDWKDVYRCLRIELEVQVTSLEHGHPQLQGLWLDVTCPTWD